MNENSELYASLTKKNTKVKKTYFLLLFEFPNVGVEYLGSLPRSSTIKNGLFSDEEVEEEEVEKGDKEQTNVVMVLMNFLNLIMKMIILMSKMVFLHFVVQKVMKTVVDLTKKMCPVKICLQFPMMRTI